MTELCWLNPILFPIYKLRDHNLYVWESECLFTCRFLSELIFYISSYSGWVKVTFWLDYESSIKSENWLSCGMGTNEISIHWTLRGFYSLQPNSRETGLQLLFPFYSIVCNISGGHCLAKWRVWLRGFFWQEMEGVHIRSRGYLSILICFVLCKVDYLGEVPFSRCLFVEF